MDNVMDAYWQTPPVARNIATAAFAISVLVHTSVVDAYWVAWFPEALWQFPPQIWRLVSGFLVTGDGLGLLFDTYFLFTYLRQLEVGNPRLPKKEDVIWYLMFVGSTILGVNYFTGFIFGFYLRAILIAMCYTVTQDQRGMTTQIYFITIPSQLMPYALMLISLIMGGPMNVVLELHGLFAAHLYDFLSRIWPKFGGGPNLIPTPSFVSRLIQTPRIAQRAYGTAQRPADSASASATGASRGPLPSAWETRGPGRRLG